MGRWWCSSESDTSGMCWLAANGSSGINHLFSHIHVHQGRSHSKSPRPHSMRALLDRRQRYPVHPRRVLTTHSPIPTRFVPPVSGASSANCGSNEPLRAASPMQKPVMSNGVGKKIQLTTPLRVVSPFRKVTSCSPLRRHYTNIPRTNSPMACHSSGTVRDLKTQVWDSGDQAKHSGWAFRADSRCRNVVSNAHARTASFQERMRQVSPFVPPTQPQGLKTSATTPCLHNVNGQSIWPGRTPPSASVERMTADRPVTFRRSVSPGCDTSRQVSPGAEGLHSTTPRLIQSISPRHGEGMIFQWPQTPKSHMLLPMPVNITRVPSPLPVARSGSRFAWSPQPPSPGTPSRSLSPIPKVHPSANSHLQVGPPPSSANFTARVSLSRVVSSGLLPKWPASMG